MLTQWASRLSTKMRRTSFESVQLLRLGFQMQPRDVRQLLLDQARSANATAANLLHIDKEINLIRYHGFWDYTKEKWVERRMLSGGKTQVTPVAEPDLSKEEAPQDSKPSQPAKISFMITSTMRNQLSEMGYESAAVKAMTPVQASLILDNAVSPEEKDNALPLLEEKHQKEMEEEAKRKMEEFEKARSLQVVDDDSANHKEETSAAKDHGDDGGSSQRAEPRRFDQLSKLPFASTNELEKSSPEPRVWFQVVQQGDEQVIGLFSTEAEARHRVEIHIELTMDRDESEQQRLEVRRIVR